MSAKLTAEFKGFAMKMYTASLWEIDLAKGWTADSDDDCVTIIKSDESGALQLSSYQKQDGIISRAELLEVTDCDTETQQLLREKTWGDFTGFQLAFSEEDTFWSKWWLADEQTLLFVTYNCDLKRKDDEKEEIHHMVGSLRSKGRAKRCE